MRRAITGRTALSHAALGCSALAIVATACGGSWDATPRARTVASEILRCPTVELAPRAENVWHATGCGGEIDVACSSGNNEPVCERVRIRGSASVVPAETEAPPGSAAEPTETEPASTAAASPTSQADADALRAAIEARRDDVLACAPRDRVAVRVRTDANGAAAVTLGGDLAGSPEEGCVRAALADLRGPPSADVIHLVRR